MRFFSKFFSKRETENVETETTKKQTIIVDGEEIELDDEAIEFLNTYENNINAARSGDGDAQMLVGKTLYNYSARFWYAMNRIDEALEWLEKAAERGYAAAYSYLGKYYFTDRYENQNYEKGVQYFSKAADLGDADGYYYLGSAYENGEGVEKDPYTAFEYYLKAAKLGDDYAKGKVGVAYYEGNIVEQDKDEAFHYLLESYEQGTSDLYGEYYLALCYLNGEGTEKEPEKCVKVLEKQCIGHSFFMDEEYELLLSCYENGIGTENKYEAIRELKYWKADKDHTMDLLANLVVPDEENE